LRVPVAAVAAKVLRNQADWLVVPVADQRQPAPRFFGDSEGARNGSFFYFAV